MKLYLGIDPGLSGAIALVDGETRCVMLEDMPTAARGHGRVRHEVDAGGLCICYMATLIVSRTV